MTTESGEPKIIIPSFRQTKKSLCKLLGGVYPYANHVTDRAIDSHIKSWRKNIDAGQSCGRSDITPGSEQEMKELR